VNNSYESLQPGTFLVRPPESLPQERCPRTETQHALFTLNKQQSRQLRWRDLEIARDTGVSRRDQDFSIVDRTSFAGMRRPGIDRVASLDAHFAGFRFGPKRRESFHAIRAASRISCFHPGRLRSRQIVGQGHAIQHILRSRLGPTHTQEFFLWYSLQPLNQSDLAVTADRDEC